MVVLISSEPIYRYWFVRQPQDFSKERKDLDSIMATWKWDEKEGSLNKTSEGKITVFNPNIASKEALAAIGFSNSLANRVVNYRLKGGKFLVKKDLMKIYEMDSVLYEKLFPFIDLPENILNENVIRKIEPKEKPLTAKFDLNKADTSQLIRIYGIGPKLSKRIVTYRDKLGGFVSPEQLTEVYGLDSLAVQTLFRKSFIDENFKPRLIDINTATEKELGDHPYIKYKLAKAIAVYRFQHGGYRVVDDLKKIALIDDAKFQKIKPYLSANP